MYLEHYDLKVEFTTGEIVEIRDVEEFVPGRKYIFYRTRDGLTGSVKRAEVENLYHRRKGFLGFRLAKMKKFKNENSRS